MAIQNLRSSSAHKRPIPTVLSAGQIAINTNQASPGLFFKDSNGDLVKVGPVHIGTSAPNSSPATTAADALVSGTVYQILTVGNTDFTAVGASANTVGVVFTATGAGTGTGTVSGQQGNEKGEQWLDTTGGAYDLKIYDGSAWRSQAGEFVNHTGDTMTGVLQFVSGSASAPGIAFSGDTNTGIFRPGADSVAVTTGGTQRITVDSSGNVGVNVASPGVRFETKGSNVVEPNSINNFLTYGAFRVQTSSSSETKSLAIAGGPSGLVSLQNVNSSATAGPLAINPFGGNVGIGTTAPGSKVHVFDANPEVRLQSSGVSTTCQYSMLGRDGSNVAHMVNIKTSDSSLTFGTGGSSSNSYVPTERLRIDSSGRLGVGTSSPGSYATGGNNLVIASSGGAGVTIKTGTTSEANIFFASAENATSNNGIIKYNQNTKEMRFQNYGGGSEFFTFYGSGNERLRIDSSGNVGIGVTSVSAKLHIAAAYNETGLKVFGGAAGYSSPLIVGNASSTEYLRVDDDGRLLVGTSSNYNVPATIAGAATNVSTGTGSYAVLSLADTSSAAADVGGGVAFQGNDGVNTLVTFSQVQGFKENSSSGDYAGAIRFSTRVNGSALTEKMRVASNGRVGIGTTSPSHFLDVKATDNTTYTAGNLIYNAVARIHNDSTTTNSFASLAFRTASGDNAIGFKYTGTANQADFVIVNDGGANGNEVFRIDSSGNVGIGTTSPSTKLHIASNGSGGDVHVTNGSGQNALLELAGNGNTIGSGSALFGQAADNTVYAGVARGAHPVILGTSNTERMRITSGGEYEFRNASTTVLKSVDTSGSSATDYGQFQFKGIRGADNDSHTYMTIDSSGRLLIGTSTSPSAGDGQYANLVVQGYPGVPTGGGILSLQRGQTANQVASGGDLGVIVFGYSNGTTAAKISCAQDAAGGTSDYPGRLVFYTTADGASSSTERMRIDSSGQVGIGTTSPSQILELKTVEPRLCLNGTTSNNEKGIEFEHNGTRYGSLFQNASSGDMCLSSGDNGGGYFITFKTNNVERMRIDSTGRVGINNSAPGDLYAERLVVDIGSAAQDGITIKSGTSAQCMLAFADGTSGSAAYAGYIDYNHSTNALSFGTNGGEKLRIDSSGRLLVGTTSYTATDASLVVDNNVSGGSVIAEFRNEVNPNYGGLRISGGITDRECRLQATYGNSFLTFYTEPSTGGSQERMRIDSSGTTSITSNVAVNGSELGSRALHVQDSGTDNAMIYGDNSGSLSIQGGASQPGSGIKLTGKSASSDPGTIKFFTTTASNNIASAERMRISHEGITYHISTNHGYHLGVTASAGTSKYIFRGHHSATVGTFNSGTTCFNVWSNGNVENTNDSYGQLSDVKLKENIVDAPSQWEDFKAVRFRKYNFKEETGYETHTQLGVIAQELELTSPGLVYETPDLDDEGNDLGTTTKAVKSSILTKKALVALQEAMNRIETLEAKVAALEAG